MDYRVLLRVEGPEQTAETQYGPRTERAKIVEIDVIVEISKAQEIASAVHRLLAGVDLRTLSDV